MTIDWITVTAQIINFLLLVWLLKRFLYQPVMRAMERREQRIADHLNEAQGREQQADEQIRHYREQAEALSRQHDELLARAREEGEQEKMKLLDEAREEVEKNRVSWQRQVDEEKTEFLDNLRHQAADAIQLLARKALHDLADSELEARIMDTFIERMKTLDSDSCEALQQGNEAVHIRTAFELDSTARARLTRAVHEYLTDAVEVEYSESPELLCGIELSRGGQQLSWHLADYMDELAERVEAAFAPLEPSKIES